MANSEFECANVYAFPKIDPIVIDDAAVTTGSNVINSASALFTVAMNGRYIIVAGAGTAGADLVGVMTYVSATQITIGAVLAATTGTFAARFNLQKLTHTHTINEPLANPSTCLKDAAHPQIATNIDDPDWKRENGTVRMGGSGILAYTLGHFANDGETYIPLHLLFSGREPFFRFNCARANPYVHIPGRIFVGLYNNNEEILDWIKGAPFELSSNIDPAAPTTVSTEYFVAVDSGQGYHLTSEVLTVADAPDDASFASGSRVTLSWQYFAGATQTKVYRKRSGGNVFLIETFDNGASSWTDINPSNRVDTGITTFPTFTPSENGVPSYFATSDGELDVLPYDGEPNQFWKPIFGRLPFLPTVDLAKVIDPHFVIGLTEPLGTKLTDVETNGTTTVVSAAAQFNADMVGKAYTLTKLDGTDEVTGTVSTYVDTDEIVLSNAPAWTEDGSILIIEDSQPRGLLFDLVGLSLNSGEWDFHVEDNNRPQHVAATPNGSSQGGIGGQDPTDTGGLGGVSCVWENAVGYVRGELVGDEYEVITKRAIDIDIEHDLLWSGHGYGRDSFNPIDWMKVRVVSELRWLITEKRIGRCTATERIVNGPSTFKSGLAVGDLKSGSKVLIIENGSAIVDTVRGVPLERGSFKVVSFGLKKRPRIRTAHLMVFDDFVYHNRKDPSSIPV